jgi:hypothetical protein
MAGPIRKPEVIRRAKSEARAVLRLSPWLLLSLLLVLILWQADTAALAGLFQSPPTDTPTVQATNTSVATPTLLPSATPALTATQVITDTPTPLPSDTPTVLPSDTPTLAPSATPTLTATQPLPAGEEALTPPAEGEGGEAAEEERRRYPLGDTGLNFEWGMLFDAVALGLSYTWLCCGVFIVLGIPLFFIVLWVASSARRQRTE